MEQQYIKKLKEMEDNNHKMIEELEASYKSHIDKIMADFEDTKRTSDGLRTMYEEKLTQQEDEHEQEIADKKSEFEKEKDMLNDIICDKKTECDNLLLDKITAEQEREKYMKERDQAILEKEKEIQNNEELNKKIELFNKEKENNQELLKQKEHDLYKYKFKIKDLQKSKHVLTHRATEMRASLEPKEQQIESLKEQILNLEKVFEQQMKAMSDAKKEEEKNEFKINQLKKELNAQKNITKEKEKTIFKIITDIHNYVQSKDEKSYAAGLMQLNQDYVKPRASDLLEKKKKDPETIEELDRQLRYMERSITQLKVNTIKNENRTRQHIKKKTMENTGLINELNKLKIERKTLKDENKKLREENTDLKDKQNMTKKQDDMIHKQHSVQSMTGKTVDDSIPSLINRPHSVKKQGKGRLYKGTPYQYRKTNLEDKAKIAEISAQLEDAQQMVMIQKLEIRSLKEKFISLVNDRNRLLAQIENGSQHEMDRTNQPMTPNNDTASNDPGFLPTVKK